MNGEVITKARIKLFLEFRVSFGSSKSVEGDRTRGVKSYFANIKFSIRVDTAAGSALGLRIVEFVSCKPTCGRNEVGFKYWDT